MPTCTVVWAVHCSACGGSCSGSLLAVVVAVEFGGVLCWPNKKENCFPIGLPVYLIHLMAVCFVFIRVIQQLESIAFCCIFLWQSIMTICHLPCRSASLPFSICHCYTLPGNWVSAILLALQQNLFVIYNNLLWLLHMV